ncbi:unnamed protein product [Scytosiphon promiscuus]
MTLRLLPKPAALGSTCTMQAVRTFRRGISSSSVRLGEVRSSGGIFDPYVYRGTGGQGLPPMTSQDGLKTRWGIMKSHLKSGMCAGVIQKHVPDFHASKFPPVANTVFKDFIDAHREGDLRALAGLTTEEMYTSLKGELKQSKTKGTRRAAFRLVDFKEPTRVLQMRVDRKKHISPKEGWGQASTWLVTCRLFTEREFVFVEPNGKEARPAKDEISSAQNVTIGVFEVFFGDSSGKWRLALVQEMSQTAEGTAIGAPIKPPPAEAQ